MVSHKLPVFAIQFLNTNEVFLLIRPEDLQDISGSMKGEKPKSSRSDFLGIETQVLEAQEDIPKSNKIIKSSGNARESYMKAHDKKFEKKSKSAR